MFLGGLLPSLTLCLLEIDALFPLLAHSSAIMLCMSCRVYEDVLGVGIFICTFLSNL